MKGSISTYFVIVNNVLIKTHKEVITFDKTSDPINLMPDPNQQQTNMLRKFDRFLGAVYFFPKNNKKYPPIKKDDADDILVLGFFPPADAVLYMPAIKVLKRNFPNSRITIACTKATEAILKDQNLIDEFFTIKRPRGTATPLIFKNYANCRSGIKAINHITYDLAIDFTWSWQSILFMNFIKAARKISYNHEGGEYMLTDPIHPNADIENTTDAAFYLLKKIGCEYTSTEKLPVLQITEQNQDFVNEFKIANKLETQFVVGVYPASSKDEKKWDEEKYSELIARLSTNYSNCTFIVFGGPAEKDLIASIEKVLKANHILDHLIVTKPLAEIGLLASLCNLVICNDISTAQVAAAYNIPGIIIFGKADAGTDITDGTVIKKFIQYDLESKPGYKFNDDDVSVEHVYNPAVSLINNLKNQ